MPYLTYALYSQFAYPPPLVNWLAIVGAVFLGGYYLWHADHLRLQKQLAVVGISAYPFTTADGHVANVYDINITNNSEAMTIHGVQVKLREISPQVEHHIGSQFSYGRNMTTRTLGYRTRNSSTSILAT
jgi:hypothetical protein